MLGHVISDLDLVETFRLSNMNQCGYDGTRKREKQKHPICPKEAGQLASSKVME